MALPFFYIEAIPDQNSSVNLNEETSKHIIQVLRMQTGERLQLTDGKGNLVTVEIKDDNRKKCVVDILETFNFQDSTFKTTIAISLLKNTSRFEWFLEKATEMGVNTIVPLICERTEKQSAKFERQRSILISSMLQSQQCWLPELKEPVKYKLFVENSAIENKFIAHCEEDNKAQLSTQLLNCSTSKLILIGPEGDFTKDEIELAKGHHFIPVSLGNTRLRTETAGVVAACLFTQL
jgi:16S rRNA (uracil1498-N3)-methyltransferase